MVGHFRSNRRVRLRLVLLAVLALLCQQVAFAAYVCPSTVMPMANMAMNADCHAMPTTKRATADVLGVQQCMYHCAHPTAVTGNAQLPTVPPLLLPAIVPALPLVAVSPASHAAHVRTAAQETLPLAPPLRYRVLLI